MAKLLGELGLQINYYFTFANLVEIIILTFLCYRFIMWIYGTQAFQIVKGAILLLALLPVCDFFGLTTLAFLIRSAFTWLFISIVILFQPELRSVFEKVGNSLSKIFLFNKTREKEAEKSINCILSSVEYFHQTKTGALIVCEVETGLRDIAKDGVMLNAELSDRLLRTIFFKNTPLHDGAVIVSIYDETIVAAACILPLTERTTLPGQMGTRHRAGVGISEQSDAFTIIVSEETGKISTTKNRSYDYDITLKELENELLQQFVQPLEEDDDSNFFTRLTQSFKGLWRSKNEEQDQSEN